MNRYMLISSRDPFTCGTTVDLYELAMEFKRQGNEVTLFLVENGVLAERAGARCPALAQAVSSGVRVVAERFSLRERAIAEGGLLAGISPAPLEMVCDALAERVRTMWH
jgi:hypothetical protein